MIAYRAGLPERPARIAALPLDARGYPIPWFVAYVDGRPDFRIGDARKLRAAILGCRCWICGQPLGRFMVFPIGPMCAMNRISAEPPCHRDCAEYALKACPFLLLPTAKRREDDLMREEMSVAGFMLPDNPGVMALWIAHRSMPRNAPGGILFHLDEPVEVVWWTQGRLATRDEVSAAFYIGLERLRATCETSSERANLDATAMRAVCFWPAEVK